MHIITLVSSHWIPTMNQQYVIMSLVQLKILSLREINQLAKVLSKILYPNLLLCSSDSAWINLTCPFVTSKLLLINICD